MDYKLLPKSRAPMHIGITGPANPNELVRYLNPGVQPELPGFGGTPVNILTSAFLDLGHRVTLATLDPTLPLGETRTLEGPNLTILSPCSTATEIRHCRVAQVGSSLLFGGKFIWPSVLAFDFPQDSDA